MKDSRILKILFLISIIGLIFISGCTIGDPCSEKFEDCNYACGEGILSSVCKEKCTWDYNDCRQHTS